MRRVGPEQPNPRLCVADTENFELGEIVVDVVDIQNLGKGGSDTIDDHDLEAVGPRRIIAIESNQTAGAGHVFDDDVGSGGFSKMRREHASERIAAAARPRTD